MIRPRRPAARPEVADARLVRGAHRASTLAATEAFGTTMYVRPADGAGRSRPGALAGEPYRQHIQRRRKTVVGIHS